MHDETAFTNLFVKFLFGRSMKAQADLIDHLFNSSEKRLARVLLIMAEIDQPGTPNKYIPPVTQVTLAAMIGTTYYGWDHPTTHRIAQVDKMSLAPAQDGLIWGAEASRRRFDWLGGRGSLSA